MDFLVSRLGVRLPSADLQELSDGSESSLRRTPRTLSSASSPRTGHPIPNRLAVDSQFREIWKARPVRFPAFLAGGRGG